uniref:CSON011192 protein n=1 Tax=Culicoides sonorensis TaxID=179676 RepID=A0A336LQY5_CULSO
MKIFLTAVFALAGLAIMLVHGQFVCPGNCAQESACLYQNLDNCTTFWQCDQANNAYLRICPTGLRLAT